MVRDGLHFTGSQQALQWYWPDGSFASEGFLFQGIGINETNSEGNEAPISPLLQQPENYYYGEK